MRMPPRIPTLTPTLLSVSPSQGLCLRSLWNLHASTRTVKPGRAAAVVAVMARSQASEGPAEQTSLPA